MGASKGNQSKGNPHPYPLCDFLFIQKKQSRPPRSNPAPAGLLFGVLSERDPRGFSGLPGIIDGFLCPGSMGHKNPSFGTRRSGRMRGRKGRPATQENSPGGYFPVSLVRTRVG